MRRLILVFLLFFSIEASADYYWTISGTGGQWPSAPAACQAVYPRFKRVDMAANGRSAQCVYRYGDNDDRDYLYTSTYRNGTACTPPKTYNSATGACDDPPPPPTCSGKAGTSTAFSKTGTAPDAYMALSNGYGAPVQSGCFGGCLASTADQKCVTKTTGAYGCRGTAWFTGAACGTEPGVDSSSSSESPDPETKTDTQPCVYSTVSGKQVCTSTKTSDSEGQTCGTVNGVVKCVAKKPTSDTSTVTTEVEKTVNPDGSTKTTKTDTATRTQCTGMKDCKSGSTTSTTSTSTDAQGNVTGSTSTCKGSSCADKNTNPDGDGDGLGDCVENCSNGEGGVTTMPELEDVDDYGTTFSKFYDRAMASPIASSLGGLSFATSGSCPNVSYHTELVGTIDSSSFCQLAPDLLSKLRYLFLACWAWAAIRLFMTA